MTLHPITVLAMVVHFQIFVTLAFILPSTVTFGIAIDDNNIRNNDQELPDLKVAHRISRLLDDGECSSACRNDDMSSFLESVVTNVEEKTEEEDDVDFFGRIFDSITSFVTRLMNRLFNLFVQREEEKYMIPTDTILPLLSNCSTKVNSLAKTIRQESETIASTTPDVIRLLYQMSAENMENVATALETILEGISQQKTTDIRIVRCGILQLLTLLHDVTVPNIVSIAEIIYTKSNNTEMNHRFNQYNNSSPFIESTSTAVLSTASSTTSNREDRDVACVDASPTTTSGRFFGGSLFEPCEFEDCTDIGPIQHIGAIILLLLLLPLSIVVSIVAGIVAIVVLLVFGPAGTLYALVFFGLFAIPISIIGAILTNILGFFEDVLNPTAPASVAVVVDQTNPTTVATRASINQTVNGADEGAFDPQQTNDVLYRLSVVLESPLEMIATIFQNPDSFSHMNDGDKSEMNCEASTLTCNNDALIDALPF